MSTTPRRVNTSAGNAFDVLRIIVQASDAPSFTEIVERIDVPDATAHRVLSTLEQSEFVERRPDDRFVAGVALAEARLALLQSFPLVPLADPFIREMASLTGQTVGLSCPVGQYAVRVSGYETDLPVNRQLHRGEIQPLHIGAAGRAILAFSPTARVDAYLESGLLAGYEYLSIATADRLKSELALIREQGFALDTGDLYPEAHAIAFPILEASGRSVASIIATGPSGTFLPGSDDTVQSIGLRIAREFGQVVSEHEGVTTSPFDHLDVPLLELPRYGGRG